MKTLWLLGFLLSMCMMGRALTPSSFLSTVDKERLRKVFSDALGKEDVPSVSYAILGYNLLGETAPNSQALCQKLQKFADAPEASVANAYQLTAAAKQLPSCSVKLGAKLTQAVSAALASDGSAGNLYYASLTQINLGQTLDKASVAKVLAAALKKDDNVANLGYAFNLAAFLDKADIKSVFDRVEDAIVQADEIDGKMLQFEGGLSVTHLVINGAYKLAEKMGKAPSIGKMQAVKFANYFLNRKSVQQAKGAFHLLDALTTLTNNKFHVPVAVTNAQSSVISEAAPNVQVKITDLLGKSLGKMDVVIESAMKTSDGSTILEKIKMTPVSGDDSAYQVDMFAAKPGRGFYELVITATPAKADERLVGNTGAILSVKAVSTITLDDIELGIGDVDQSVAAKTHKVTYPTKFAKVMEADHHHKVTLKFTVKEKANPQEKVKVHQAFVTLINTKTKAEIVFVAEPTEDAVYSFELDVSAKAKEFAGVSGKYQMKMVIGDAVIANPLSWDVADLQVTFSSDAAAAAAISEGSTETGVKPEIKHKFREPEKRPPAVVSNAFTFLCLTPFAVLFLAWAKLGVNVSGFPISLTSVGFHLGLGAIFALYYFFWLNMGMFSTMKYLIMIGVVTFLCGNSMLSKIAEKRKN